MPGIQAFLNWSGGKDAAFSLYKLQRQPLYTIRTLLTTLSDPYRRISMHGVREILLDEQIRCLGYPLQKIYLPEQADLNQYNRLMEDQLKEFRQQGITHAVFGDIFLRDLRDYREKQLAQAGIEGCFPLWKMETHELINDFIEAGFKAVVTCVNTSFLDKRFTGRIIDRQFINDLPANVDPCGENGEFHSFVFDGPIFRQPVRFHAGEVVERNYSPKKENDDREECFKKEADWDTRFFFQDLLPDF